MDKSAPSIIQPKAKRSKVVKIRLHKAEHLQLLDQAGDSALACYIRDQLLAGDKSQRTSKQYKKRIPGASERNTKLIREVGRIGNNLNQIAKYINTQNKHHQPVDHVLISLRLYSIWEQLRDL